MKRLLLLRHAEADPALSGQPDIARPLSDRGRNEAIDVAQCLRDNDLRIDAILLSPAVRTRETATIIAAQLDIADTLQFDSALYLGAPDKLLPPVQATAASVQTLLVVGHNPGLSELASSLMTGSQPVALRTGGLCRVEFDDDSWEAVQPQSALSVSVLR